MKDEMKVIRINKNIATEFVSKKHYSRKPSIYWDGFGLVENDHIVGVAVYGQPSPALQKHAFNRKVYDNFSFSFMELSRLVVQSKTPNAASFLIGRSLQMLQPPVAVVSYADTRHGHCGIIYQATNWLYTGSTVSHDKLYIIDGMEYHPLSLRSHLGITNPGSWAKENKIETVSPKKKHRYFFFCWK
jgi:hypothetical protein